MTDTVVGLSKPKILIGQKACEKCQFASPERPEGGYVCRRNPPQIIALEAGGGRYSIQNLWPVVQANNWCGEWKLRLEGLNG